MFSNGYYMECCFYAQQSIEFLLKGLMIRYLGVRSYTHDLLMLYNSVKDFIGEIDRDKLSCLKFLSEQYIGSRYPDTRVGEYDRLDGEKCIDCLKVLWSVFKTD